MDENYQSEWTKSIPLKEQKKIIKRLMKFAKPFRRTFIVAILFVCPVCDQCPIAKDHPNFYG